MAFVHNIKSWHEAVIRYENGDIDSSLSLLSRITNPSAKIWYNIGMIHWSKKSYSEAIEALTHSVEHDDYFALGYLQRAVLRYMQDRFEEALHDLDQVIRCLRCNYFIDYKQLGLLYKLWSYQVLYDTAVVESKLGMKVDAKEMLECALGFAQEDRHKNFIQDAIKKLQSNILSSQPLHHPNEIQLFKPPACKISQLSERPDFLGKAQVIFAINTSSLPKTPFDNNQQNVERNLCTVLSNNVSPKVSSSSNKPANRPPPPSYKPKPPATNKKPERSPSPKCSASSQSHLSSVCNNKESAFTSAMQIFASRSTPQASSTGSQGSKLPTRPSPPNAISTCTSNTSRDTTSPRIVPMRPPPPHKSQAVPTMPSSKSKAMEGSPSPRKSAESSFSSITSNRTPPARTLYPQGHITPRTCLFRATSQNSSIVPHSLTKKDYVIAKIHCIYTRAFKIEHGISPKALLKLIRKAYEPPEDQKISLWCKMNKIPLCVDEVNNLNQVLRSDNVMRSGRVTIWCFDG